MVLKKISSISSIEKWEELLTFADNGEKINLKKLKDRNLDFNINGKTISVYRKNTQVGEISTRKEKKYVNIVARIMGIKEDLENNLADIEYLFALVERSFNINEQNLKYNS